MEQYNLNNVITIKIKSGVFFQGILIDVGVKWALIKYIPVDFIIDGYALINLKYVSESSITDDDIFIQKVLNLKKVDFESPFKFNLNENEELFNDLSLASSFIGIELKNHNKKFVGEITKVKEKSVKVHLINKVSKFLDEETFLYSEIRAIYFEDDYLISLNLLSLDDAKEPHLVQVFDSSGSSL
jgi:hypothetical protein